MGKIEQSRRLTKANQAISQRIMTRIIWCSLPRYRLETIMIEVCRQDKEFSEWLDENGWADVYNPKKNVKNSTYSKGDFTRFPWFDNKGKLMIKLATIDEIERLVNSLA